MSCLPPSCGAPECPKRKLPSNYPPPPAENFSQPRRAQYPPPGLSHPYEIQARDDHIRHLELENMRLQLKNEQVEKDKEAVMTTLIAMIKANGKTRGHGDAVEMDVPWGTKAAELVLSPGGGHDLKPADHPQCWSEHGADAVKEDESKFVDEDWATYEKKHTGFRPSMCSIENPNPTGKNIWSNNTCATRYDLLNLHGKEDYTPLRKPDDNGTFPRDHKDGEEIRPWKFREPARLEASLGSDTVHLDAGPCYSASSKICVPSTGYECVPPKQYKHWFGKNKQDRTGLAANDNEEKFAREPTAWSTVRLQDKHPSVGHPMEPSRHAASDNVRKLPLRFKFPPEEDIGLAPSPEDSDHVSNWNEVSAGNPKGKTIRGFEDDATVEGPRNDGAQEPREPSHTADQFKDLVCTPSWPPAWLSGDSPPQPSRAKESSPASVARGPCADTYHNPYGNGEGKFSSGRGLRDNSEPLTLYHKYGIQYSPPPTEKNLIRTVLIENLPSHLDIRDIVTRARDSPFSSIKVYPTSGFKYRGPDGRVCTLASSAALMVFFLESSAEQFVFDLDCEPLILERRVVKARVIKTATYPQAAQVNGAYDRPLGRLVSRRIQFYQPGLVPANIFEEVLHGSSHGFRTQGWIVERSCKMVHGRNVITVEFCGVETASWAFRRILHDSNFFGCEPMFVYDHEHEENENGKGAGGLEKAGTKNGGKGTEATSINDDSMGTDSFETIGSGEPGLHTPDAADDGEVDVLVDI